MRNYWKLSVLALLTAVALAAVAAAGYGALLGYQAHVYLSTQVGEFDKKPLTRAGFLDLMLAREAQAAKAAEAPPGATK